MSVQFVTQNRKKNANRRSKGVFKGDGARGHSPVGQWLQIMVTTDANKMHQNVAFAGIKFQNFLGPSPHTAAFLTSFGGLIIAFRLCRGLMAYTDKNANITVLPFFWLFHYDC